jgi:hypothetical protein
MAVVTTPLECAEHPMKLFGGFHRVLKKAVCNVGCCTQSDKLTAKLTAMVFLKIPY